MHRIDGPTAAPGGFFTEGDPVGGVPATIVSDDWANDVQENIIAPITAAGITLVKGDFNQLLMAIRALSAGVVGTVRKGRMLLTTASATAPYTADEVIVKSALGGRARALGAFNQQVILTNTGINGMFGGAVPLNGFVAFYAACKEDGTRGMFAVNATAGAVPEIAASAPTDYVYTALVGFAQTDGAGLVKPVFIRDRRVSFPTIQFLATTVAQGSPTSISLSTVVPLNAVSIKVRASIAAGTAGVSGTFTFGGSAGQIDISQGAGILPTAGVAMTQELGFVSLTIPQTGFYTDALSTGTISNFTLSGTGFEF